MMFVPLILAQGQNLSLLSTATIENILQLMNQITSFLDEHQLDSSQILNEADITSKINLIIPDFLNTIVNTVSSLE
jgi:hypothetical protein